MEQNYIKWIGTGSGLNSALGNTSFLASCTQRALLVDCGFTVPSELTRINKLRYVTDIVITHAHADHIGGLESLGFTNYFVFGKKGNMRPNLYLGTDEFAHKLWENSLKGGMEKIQNESNQPMNVTLDTYFKIHTGKEIKIPGLPVARLFETPHVPGLENYGLEFDNGIFYSGDTLDLPKKDSRLIFQDCQFQELTINAHITYDKLKRDLPPEVKSKTLLVHLGKNWNEKNPIADGFAGFVMPGDAFEL